MKEFQDLVDIISQLRDPVSGCPWDVKQTSQSLVPNFIEELYEAVEAIEDEDDAALMEELGDLMLHIVFQAQIAGEERRFDIADVLDSIRDKLVRRLKKLEKNDRKSVLEGIPRALPALIYAQRTQEKAASVGFDWPEIAPIMDKLTEERGELDEALAAEDYLMIKDELGDMLFTLVNLARKLHIDAESALKETTRKFHKRFHYIEEHYRQNGANIHEASLEELDALWDLAKKDR